VLQEGERVLGVRELAEDHDPGLGARLAQPLSGLDPLVAASRRHANVGQDDIGARGLDRFQQRIEIAARRRHLEVMLRLEEPADAFTHEVVVLRQHDPDRHRAARITHERY
jgi:hypothetical protein